MIPLLITRSIRLFGAAGGTAAGLAAWLVPISVALIGSAGLIGSAVIVQLLAMRHRPTDTEALLAFAKEIEREKRKNARLEARNARLEAQLAKAKGGDGG